MAYSIQMRMCIQICYSKRNKFFFFWNIIRLHCGKCHWFSFENFIRISFRCLVIWYFEQRLAALCFEKMNFKFFSVFMNRFNMCCLLSSLCSFISMRFHNYKINLQVVLFKKVRYRKNTFRWKQLWCHVTWRDALWWCNVSLRQ